MLKIIQRLSVFASLLLLVVFGASCTRKDKSYLLKQAEGFESRGEYEKAEIQYLNVLQLDPREPRAMTRLGMLYFEQGRSTRGIPYLLKAEQLQPNDLQLRMSLGLLYISSGKFPEARNEANFILQQKKNDPDALLLLVETATNAKEAEEIRGQLATISNQDAQSSGIQIALGALERRLSHMKEAEDFLQKGLQLDPSSTLANSELGTLYWAKKDYRRADDYFVAAQKSAPPRSPRRLQLAQFRMQTGNRDGAKKALEEVLQKTPDYVPARAMLGELAASENKLAEADSIVTQVLNQEPTYLDALILRGRILLARGDIAKAIDEFEKLVKLSPKSPQIYYQLGHAYLANGEVSRAISSLTQAVTIAPDFSEAIVLLAGININKGDGTSAIIGLKPLIRQRPDLAQPRLLLAEAYRTQGNLGDALETYQAIEKTFPGNPRTSWLMGMILVQQGKAAEARRAFELSIERDKEFLPAVEQLVNLDLASKDYTSAAHRVDEEIKKKPSLASLRVLQAQVFLIQQQLPEAEAALKKAIELEPDSSSAYLLLARIYINSHRQKDALAELTEISSKKPNDAAPLMLIGVIYDEDKNYTAARDNYEKLLKISPKFSSALNNLAYLYSEHFGELDKAYELAKRARDLLPNEPNTADTLGWIMYKKRDYAWASSLLQESARNAPTSAEIQYHLGMSYYATGDEARARANLERALKLKSDFAGSADARAALFVLDLNPESASANDQKQLEKQVTDRPDDSTAKCRLAEVYSRDGNSKKASELSEAAIRENPNSILALLTAAKLANSKHDSAKALEYAKNARKLAPDSPEVAQALGLAAYQSGDYKWSVSLLQEAANRSAGSSEIFFDLARALYAVGQLQLAETTATHAVEASAPFSRKDAALRFIDLTRFTNDPSSSVSASNIEKLILPEPSSAPALFAKAINLERSQKLVEAKTAYEDTLNHFPELAPAAKRAAILFADDPQDAQKAYNFAMKARETMPEDSDLAKVLGSLVYRKGDYAAAANFLKESAVQRKDDPEVLYYLGMAESHLKDNSGARDALEHALALNLKPDWAAEARTALAKLK